MMEIERKFYISPKAILENNLLSLPFNLEERYYLFAKDGIELRFTKITKPQGSEFTFDRMSLSNGMSVSRVVRTKERIKISKEEFSELLRVLKLSKPDISPITRKSIIFSSNPKIEIKIYEGSLKGLVRAEIEFEDIDASTKFIPFHWMGMELTDHILGDDSCIPNLSTSEIKDLISKF